MSIENIVVRHVLALLYGFGLTGCISISTWGDYDPDVEDRATAAYNAIIDESRKVSEKLIKNNQSNINTDRIEYLSKNFSVAKEIADVHYDKIRKSTANTGRNAFLPASIRQRRTVLSLSTAINPTIHVIKSANVSAIAFPSGEIVITDALLSTFDISSTDYNDALIGILVHELIHIFDGHSADQWATAEGRRRFLVNQGMNIAGSVFQFMPFLSMSHNVNLGSSYQTAREIPKIFESVADLGAIELLISKGRDPFQYTTFLRTIDAASNVASQNKKEPFAWLADRLKCIDSLPSKKFDFDIDLLIIGDPEKESEFASIQIPSKIVGALDDPIELRKIIKAENSKTDAEIKKEAIDFLQKLSFSLCAIKASFPKSKTDGRVLKIPSFDVNSFIQFY